MLCLLLTITCASCVATTSPIPRQRRETEFAMWRVKAPHGRCTNTTRYISGNVFTYICICTCIYIYHITYLHTYICIYMSYVCLSSVVQRSRLQNNNAITVVASSSSYQEMTTLLAVDFDLCCLCGNDELSAAAMQR